MLDLATACSSVAAAVTNGFPSSDSNAAVANIDVNANQVLGRPTVRAVDVFVQMGSGPT